MQEVNPGENEVVHVKIIARQRIVGVDLEFVFADFDDRKALFAENCEREPAG